MQHGGDAFTVLKQKVKRWHIAPYRLLNAFKKRLIGDHPYGGVARAATRINKLYAHFCGVHCGTIHVDWHPSALLQ